MARDYGSGSISQRKDGRFEVRLRILDENGKAKQKGLGYAASRREAVRLLEEGRRRYYTLDGKRRTQGAAHTVESFLRDVWLPVAQASVDEATYYGYRKLMEKHVIPVIGKKRLDALTGADDKELQRRAFAAGLKPSTIKNMRTVFGTALQYAVGELELPEVRNVVRHRKPLYPVAQSKYTLLSPEQARRLLVAADESPYRHVFAVMFFCGLRINEALGICWPDVDFTTATLHVEHQLKGKAGGAYRLAAPKKGSTGLIDLPEPAIGALKAQKVVQETERKASAVVWLNKGKLVFTEPNGLRMADWNVRRHLYRILAAAALPRIKPHWLRHSFASVLLANGVALPVVSHQLRHANTGITARTYSHMLDEQVGVAGAAMTRAFGTK